MGKRHVSRAKRRAPPPPQARQGGEEKKPWFRPNDEQAKATSSYMLGLSGAAAAGAAMNGWLSLTSAVKTWSEAGVLAWSALVLFLWALWLLKNPGGGAQ